MNHYNLAQDLLTFIQAQNTASLAKFAADNAADIASGAITVRDHGDRVEIIDRGGAAISLAWSGVVYASMCTQRGVSGNSWQATRLVVIR